MAKANKPAEAKDTVAQKSVMDEAAKAVGNAPAENAGSDPQGEKNSEAFGETTGPSMDKPAENHGANKPAETDPPAKDPSEEVFNQHQESTKAPTLEDAFNAQANSRAPVEEKPSEGLNAAFEPTPEEVAAAEQDDFKKKIIARYGADPVFAVRGMEKTIFTRTTWNRLTTQPNGTKDGWTEAFVVPVEVQELSRKPESSL